MKKAFDQTVRDLKRGVNKKVLKVPRVEQKILDATSNEPWGPHGTLLADIAQASRNYHEYQMIMSVIWKRLNDTGKNWRHVYKALTVLDYLTAHGSERVIDDIREHSYQIGTLAEFQYIDSSGRDQGQNVRRKSQSLVSLVNNKERIQEVRQKADANREKYRTSFSTSGGNRPGSYPGSGGDDDRSDRSESRYGDQNGYGREREREREYNGGGSEDRYEGGRYSNYRDDDYRSSRNSDGGYGGASRNRHSFDDDDRHSSQSGGGGGGIGRKLSEPNMASAVPPSYEDATRDSPIPSHEERNGQGEGVNGPESPPAVQAKSDSTVESTPPVQEAPPAEVPPPDPTPAAADGFDEFDPRNAFIASAAAPTESVPPQTAPAVNNMEMDFFGSDPIGQLALVTTTAEEQPISNNSGFDDNGLFGMPNELSSGFGQGGGAENPFGDAGVFTASQESTSNTASFNAFPGQSNAEPTPPVAPKMEAAPSFNFGDAFGDMNFGATPSGAGQENSFGGATPFMSDDLSTALALVPVAPQTSSTPSSNPFPPNGAPNQFAPNGAPNQFAPTGGFQQPNQFAPTGGFQQPNQFAPTGGFQQPNQFAPTGVVHQNNQFAPTGLNQPPNPYFGGPTQQGYMGPQATNNQGYVPQVSYQVAQNQTVPTTATFNHAAPPPQQVNQQPPMFSMEAPAPPAVKPQTQPQPTRKFETKSSVWTDTLSRGLVNLNISGPSINPHADIGIDFDSMNRKDKREEKKPVVPAVSSTTMMGKAMGSGSGTGRTNAPTMAPPRNPMPGMGGMGGGMGGMGMGTGMGMGMGMNNGTNAGYGMGMGMGMNPQMGMGMNPQMGMGGMGNNNGMGGMGYGGVGMGMGMGMNNNNGTGAGQPMPMRPMGGMPPGGPGAPGVGYNPMTGTGYGSQQQYGGGYR